MWNIKAISNRNAKLIAFALAVLFWSLPVFGQVPGSPGDTLMHTVALYCTNQLIWYGGGAGIVIGGLKHMTSHGERGHGWVYAGATGLAVAASARSILGLTGAVGAL
jgi:hypothetical protein